MRIQILVKVATALLVHASLNAPFTLDDANIGRKVTTACDAMQYLDANTDKYADKVQELTAALEKNIHTLKIKKLQHCRTTGYDIKAVQALISYNTTLMFQQAGSVAVVSQKALSSSATTRKQIGVTSLSSVLQETTFNDVDTAITENGRNNNPVTVKLKLTANSAAACKVAEQVKVWEKMHVLGSSKQTNIPLVADETLQPTNPTPSLQMKCGAKPSATSPQWMSAAQAVGCSAETQPALISFSMSSGKISASNR
uniref:Variant surface glycoprotein 1125.5744 n=1 Tax=Trypanosoma brucei TaxID=5691 RepID=A0A1J0RDH2_9TRYP|nr:variant surface glycoprotein 1125.5744 [Trypanosoma brucei]